ncbi:BatA domain-containing protein [Pontibacter chinhatensis]|uniref:N-terminal double-transmembrane domain-containing protein n=1 Tax=Pontibacter chinhatensis TaxID=1436961 RepID=A0A1I2XZ83_9BACT|nr:BatA domain-containing protein [Pontibacter chinhatensis]SFH18733.1 N-terminal double-transmembrane domain-containing protein [Pontibacter chinhatensis]
MAFLYPSFLFALAAVAVPIILHLVQLRRAKRVMFSNVRFIQASKDLTASQRNLKELLILLCRILFIVFLVLAFAQPFLPAADVAAPGDSSDVAIVVDNSYSMQNLQANENLALLNVATDKAKAITGLFPASTSFRLQTSDNLNHGAPVEKGEVAAILDGIDMSAKSFAPGAAFRVQPSHLFILSDFQKNNFSPAVLDAADSATQVHLVPLEAASTSNITIDSVYLEDEFLRPGAENRLFVLLSNTGDEAVEDVPVKLYLQDQQAAALSIDLPANQATQAVMTFKITGSSTVNAYVQVEDYPVDFDNTYYFVLAPSSPISIVEVTDNPQSELRQLYQSEPFFKFTAFRTNSIDYASFAAADIVILNGIQSMPAALAATAANYVKEGGTLTVIPPNGNEIGAYTTLFQNLNIPASFTGAGKSGAKTTLATPDPNNPFFRSIFSDFNAEMQMPAASRSITWSRASDDILKYRGGAPFLSRFDRGSGAVFLMAAPLNEDYSTLPNHALFVPVMYRLAIGSYKQVQQLAYTLGGGTVQLPAPAHVKREGVYELEKDTMAFIPEQQVRGGRLYFNVPPDMNEAGFYTLQRQDSVLTTLAFNYDKQESYLQQYSPDELRSLVGKDRSNVHVYDYGDAFSVKGEFEKRYFGVKLWKYCLILCLFFLMAEIALIRFL